MLLTTKHEQARYISSTVHHVVFNVVHMKRQNTFAFYSKLLAFSNVSCDSDAAALDDQLDKILADVIVFLRTLFRRQP
jgi:hypothetical protein